MTNFFWVIPFTTLLWSLGFFFLVRMEEVTGYTLCLGPAFEGGFEMTFLIDSFSMIFLMMVSLVSTLVLIYSSDYFASFLFEKKFFLIMISFICSMLTLSLSGDLFWVMVGWDGLGITSFYLIIFYQNWKSYNSAMVTFMTNRLGDFFMISSAGILLMLMGDVKFWSQSNTWVVYFMILGALTKSAQVPFSGWLPLAMAAPTPVSSLVHSSTLVTAGVYILIRFNLYLTESMKILVFYVGILTIFLAGISSMGEYDLKKVIALSTLSHIGLMVMFIGMGSILSAKIHLMIHAFFKSVLFMTAGSIIHASNGCQDLRLLSSAFLNVGTSSTFLVSTLSMMGAPFLAGFYSKEIMCDKCYCMTETLDKCYCMAETLPPSLLGFFGFLSGALMTCSYSVRLIYYLYVGFSSMTPTTICESKTKLVYLWGTVFSTILGSSVVSVMIQKEFVEDFTIFSLSMKIFLFTAILFGILVGQSVAKLFNWIPSSFKLISTTMWLIHSVSKVSQSSLFTYSHIYMYQFDIKGSLDSIVISLNNKFSSSKKWASQLIEAPLSTINLLTLSFVLLLIFF